jgi:hypothetical protein
LIVGTVGVKVVSAIVVLALLVLALARGIISEFELIVVAELSRGSVESF